MRSAKLYMSRLRSRYRDTDLFSIHLPKSQCWIWWAQVSISHWQWGVFE